MKSEQLLAAFTPSIMSHETLEAIFVRRESLAARLMDNLRTSATTPSKRHSVLVGPRGIGKTYLVSLLYYRVKQDEELQNRFRIAWLREENWEVASFLDLMESIIAALATEYEDKTLRTDLMELKALSLEHAEAHAERLLLDFLEDRILLLIVENLDDLFGSIGEIGQRQFRAFLQNHVNTVLLATTPSLFQGVSDHDAPFYNFFTVTHLDELTLDDAVQLLEKIADLREDPDLAAFIRTDTGRDRLEAVQHLAGGHPRIWIFFAGIVTEEALDALVPVFLQMLDDLTPYYQSRMKELPPQQRKIVSHLCTTRGAVPVKEIADACRLSQSQTAAQLHNLREKAFVRNEAIGRESWYELNEPLMRLVFEIKESRGRPIRLIVDFLRRWYNRSERRAKFASTPMEAHITRLYVEAALDLRGFSDAEPRFRESSTKWSVPNQLMDAGEFEKALSAIEDMIEETGRLATAQQWIFRGRCLYSLKHSCEALKSLDRAIELDPTNAYAYSGRGATLIDLNRFTEALESLDCAIEYDTKDADTYYWRGVTLYCLDHLAEALDSFDRAIELNPTDAIAHHYRGYILQVEQRYDEALASFNRVIELRPFDTDGYVDRGVILNALKRYNEAFESLNRSIELDAGDILTFYNRANSFLSLGRWSEFVVDLQKALHATEFEYYEQWGYTRSYCQLLLEVSPVYTLPERIVELVECYAKHQALKWLGQGLMESLSDMFKGRRTFEVNDAWNAAWQTAGAGHADLEIPLRLLDAAVQWYRKPDRRILLRLPIEERRVLEKILPPQE